MSVEEIPSDELVAMSDSWHKEFNESGCDPMCHCCKKMISIGDKFKLAITSSIRRYPPYKKYDNNIDVMLCENCTVENYDIKAVMEAKERWETKPPERMFKKSEGGGCFRINGKIVH